MIVMISKEPRVQSGVFSFKYTLGLRMRTVEHVSVMFTQILTKQLTIS